MDLDYIIVQAGGKGTRMEKLTRNKPKALVPVNNLPMIFHLFKRFPRAKFIIIGDYKYDVLVKYLREFAPVNYQTVCGAGHSGTCAGLNDALGYIPDKKSFMLVWCDLVLPEGYSIPDTDQNIIGISKDFPCRWRYENNEFAEERSQEYGVAGLFVFQDKTYLCGVPSDGEFVRWLRDEGQTFEMQPLFKTHEYGLIEEWEKLPKSRCRPFNKIVIDGDKVYKYAIDEQGQSLAKREINWYKSAQRLRFDNIPKIYSYAPLCIERIRGKNIYEYCDFSFNRKKKVLESIIDCLIKAHSLGNRSSDIDSYRKAYLEKTYQRLAKVRNLVPFADKEYILINGKMCRNIFYFQNVVNESIMSFFPKTFCFIHGDCTFSNILLRNDDVPVLIDPRGYFGDTELYGDAAYDWAKLYYSLVSNYDQFNLKRFDLIINGDGVKLKVASSGWELLEEHFFELLKKEVTKKQMKLLLSIIWLSLTTYSWEDYDSICGAFYNGVYYLEEALS